MNNYLRYFLIHGNSKPLLSFANYTVGPGYIKFHIISNSKDLPLSYLVLAVMKGGVEIFLVNFMLQKLG